MNRTLLWFVVIVLIACGVWYLWSSQVSPPPEPSLALSAALYPLYGGADWNAPREESFVIGTTTYSGASASSTVIAAGMDPGSVFMPFTRYYDRKLKALGWSVSNDLAAGGHVGGQTGYRKGGAVILTRFHIDYHVTPKNAPSECPCDVTLSIFSSNP